MNKLRIAQTIALLACMQPLFLLTLKGWGSGILVIASLISIGLIIFNIFSYRKKGNKWMRAEIWLVIAFLSPSATTLFAAALRLDNDTAQFDSPSRFILAVFLYIAIRNYDIHIIKFLKITIPAGILITLLYQIIQNDIFTKIDNRAQTYFMDAIMFGYIILSLGLMALFLGNSESRDKYFSIGINLIAGIAGIFLSILSQSRTGWLAIIFIAPLYIFISTKNNFIKFKTATITTGFLCIICVWALYPHIKHRIDHVYSELSEYSFIGKAPDTSIGLRITYARIAKELVSQKPLTGYGDTAKITPDFPQKSEQYSSNYVKNTIFQVGFHNELIASTIRSGILGAASTLAIFLVPLIIFIRYIRLPSKEISISAVLGLILTLVVSISAITIETFGLKFAASYYSCMIAILSFEALKNYHLPTILDKSK